MSIQGIRGFNLVLIHDCCAELKKAGDGNRTHMTSLEGWGFAIKLHPHKC